MTKWERPRWLVGTRQGSSLILFAAWIFFVVWIVTDRFELRDNPATANWAALFLAVAVLLFLAQAYFQVLARQLEYLSLLWSVVLFVQAATIETALLIDLDADDTQVDRWYIR